jgi:hypothetical protein
LKDRTFFASDLFPHNGLIAIQSSLNQTADSDAKIEPQPTDGREVKLLSQFPKFLNQVFLMLKLLKIEGLAERLNLNRAFYLACSLYPPT